MAKCSLSSIPPRFSSIPLSMANCIQVTELDMSMNSLRGEIPSGVWRIPTLVDFFVSQNHLSREVTELHQLCRIQLQINRISGDLFNFILGLKAMKHIINKVTVKVLKNYACFDDESESIQDYVNEKNIYQGIIPKSIGELWLLKMINLSNNNFNGCITWELDTVRVIRSLKEQALLSRKCGNSAFLDPNPTEEENQVSDSPWKFGWEPMAIRYGCGVVIGLVLQYYVITRAQLYRWFRI